MLGPTTASNDSPALSLANASSRIVGILPLCVRHVRRSQYMSFASFVISGKPFSTARLLAPSIVPAPPGAKKSGSGSTRRRCPIDRARAPPTVPAPPGAKSRARPRSSPSACCSRHAPSGLNVPWKTYVFVAGGRKNRKGIYVFSFSPPSPSEMVTHASCLAHKLIEAVA